MMIQRGDNTLLMLRIFMLTLPSRRKPLLCQSRVCTLCMHLHHVLVALNCLTLTIAARAFMSFLSMAGFDKPVHRALQGPTNYDNGRFDKDQERSRVGESTYNTLAVHPRWRKSLVLRSSQGKVSCALYVSVVL